MVETIWIYAEKDGFLSGWGNSPSNGTIEVPNSQELREAFGLYRMNLKFLEWINTQEVGIDSFYTIYQVNEWLQANPEEDLFVLDESNALRVDKSRLLDMARQSLDRLSEYGFEITIDGEIYTYLYNSSNKNYLNKINDIMDRGYLETATFIFKKNGMDVSKDLNKTNIYELWVKSFLHEETTSKNYSKILEEVNSAKTLAELSLIEEKLRNM